MGLGHRGGDVLPTFEVLPCMLLSPAVSAFGQIGLPLGDAWFGDRTDEQIWAEHIFIFLFEGLRIVGKVEHKGAHQRVAFFRDALCTLLDIWQQALALLQTLCDDGLCLWTVVPGLGVAHITMHTH